MAIQESFGRIEAPDPTCMTTLYLEPTSSRSGSRESNRARRRIKTVVGCFVDLLVVNAFCGLHVVAGSLSCFPFAQFARFAPSLYLLSLKVWCCRLCSASLVSLIHYGTRMDPFVLFEWWWIENCNKNDAKAAATSHPRATDIDQSGKRTVLSESV